MARVRIAVPPVDGAANSALVRFLADAAGVAGSRVRILSGTSGRRKRVLFEGLTVEALEERLRRSWLGSLDGSA